MKTNTTTKPLAKVYVSSFYGLELTDLLCEACGLQVTRALTEEGEPTQTDDWNVTHKASGLSVAKGFREATARKLMHTLAGMADSQGMGFDGAVKLTRGDSPQRTALLNAIAEARREDAE